jgi:Ca2+-binding RTX toxin-like protein
VLIGGAGADVLDGGADLDVASYQGSAAGVTVSLVEGVIGVGGDAEGDRLSGIEVLSGSELADTLTGNADANVLRGAAGDDKLDGGEGDDGLDGGAGNDTLLGGLGKDRLVGGAGADAMDGGGGVDEASYASSAAGVNVSLVQGVAGKGGDAEGDTLTSIEIVSGSKFADTLTGNAGANILAGMDGDDTLDGGDGIDTLTGGAGADHLWGGAGNDTLIGGEGADVFHFADGFGVDLVSDFKVGEDKVDMTGVAGLDSFDQLQVANVEGGAAVIFNGQAILFSGLTAADITSDLFLI